MTDPSMTSARWSTASKSRTSVARASKSGAMTVAAVSHAPARSRIAFTTILTFAVFLRAVTAGRILRGAAILGAVEALAIGLAVRAVGGRLVVPVMVLTFFAAFVPFVGDAYLPVRNPTPP